MTSVIEIISANYIESYSIQIGFNNGTEKKVDFKPFLLKALHPSISKYLDENLFKQFKITDGNLNWSDYDMIFPIHDLHEGVIYKLG
jgi:Protein of unknown function (DUF2442)